MDVFGTGVSCVAYLDEASGKPDNHMEDLGCLITKLGRAEAQERRIDDFAVVLGEASCCAVLGPGIAEAWKKTLLSWNGLFTGAQAPFPTSSNLPAGTRHSQTLL